ncbi:MAG TPA: flagellar export chaperone FliS [Bryobacteraceae bacterium]|nr:flagellar export chaperone FliS [Bryobacteraceae bacterium]
MVTTIYDTYLEAEVYGADPVKLIHMLYRGAIEAVGAARRHLAAKQIRERSRQVTKAWNIVHELSRSLDFERGGEIARRLGELYDYMQSRLVEANARQVDGPLAEVESLLSTLCEAWQSAKLSLAPPVAEAVYEPVSCSY